MSRHEISARQAGLEVAVGWDNPMQTYFAQVERNPVDDDEDDLLVWLGKTHREHLIPETLVKPLACYADLDQDMLAQLRRDRAEGA